MALGKRKPFHTPHRKRKIFWRRAVYGASSLILLASFGALVFYGTRMHMLSVSDIVVRGVETIPSSLVEERTDALLSGTYFWLIPHRFSFLVPRERIIESVRAIPRVADVAVHTQNGALIVSVTERMPTMLWCGTATTSDCFYIDQKGVAYEKAPKLSGTTLVRFVVSNVEPKEGWLLLSDATRTMLVEIARIIEEQHSFKISRIEYNDETNDATMYLALGGKLFISTTDTLETTYANLASILASEEYSSLEPGNFEYIDLRFGSKVFVQKEVPPPATSTPETLPVE